MAIQHRCELTYRTKQSSIQTFATTGNPLGDDLLSPQRRKSHGGTHACIVAGRAVCHPSEPLPAIQ